jgi:tRNA nucleotidyltransferase (CCA-adding enzyme)
LQQHGAQVLAVGGAVRDGFLGRPIKDLDCEVYGLSLSQLEELLGTFGPVSHVGKAFGVLRIHGLEVDWSVPRTDSVGRKPNVTLDATLSFKQAFMRRDLTINAMGIDLMTGDLIDPYQGLTDLQNNILRAPNVDTFVEDPLRLFRVMQFISRFAMGVDVSLNAVCATMDVTGVSRERIEQEFKKMLLLAGQPSLGLRWLAEIGRIRDIFPELYALKDVPQRSDYHPEGDVFEHTMQALDAAAIIAKTYTMDYEKLVLMYAALCHDIGKPYTTVWDQNRWRSPGHAHAGVPIARTFLRRITREIKLIKTVCTLVEHHMAPGEFVHSTASDGAYKKLATQLYPYTDIRTLTHLAQADTRGRNPDSQKPLDYYEPRIDQFYERAQSLGVLDAPESPVLQGQDLFDICQPGPQLGVLLKRAYAYQIKHGIRDPQRLKRYIEPYAKKINTYPK